MEIPKIKHVSRMGKTLTRKRDGAVLTHRLCLAVTTDEALLISEFFTKCKEKESSPSVLSLISGALQMIANKVVDEHELIRLMTQWRVKAELVDQLTRSEVDKALALLSESKKTKPQAHQPSTPKARRVFIPDPPKFKR